MDHIKKGKPFSETPFRQLCDVYFVCNELYYKHNHPILPDTAYDKMCRYLLDNYEEAKEWISDIETYIPKANLKAGTGYKCECPDLMKNVAVIILNHALEGSYGNTV